MINENTYISPTNTMRRFINILGIENTVKLIEMFKGKPKTSRRINTPSKMCNLLELVGSDRFDVICNYNFKQKEFYIPSYSVLDRTTTLSKLREDIERGLSYKSLHDKYGVDQYQINRVKHFQPLNKICNNI